MRGRIRDNTASERGQAMVELALLLPMLLVLVLAIVQFGIIFNNYETMTDATRVGARQAILLRLNGGLPSSAETVVRNAAASLNQTNLKVTIAAPSWTTPGTDVTVTATYPYSINLLGWVVASGNLSSVQVEPLE
ncbi:MAG: TadE/TadG family type IV pilus assembly protein [Gaiellaceae bacterium]